MEIKITKTQNPGVMPAEDKLGFGKVFTDHMLIVDYDSEKGWHDARIEPFGRISLHPASTVLHYGAEIFEGLKAYRREDGGVQLFRPTENIKRMNNSAERMSLPQMNEQDMLELLTTFVKLEERWVPKSFGTSLYLRPFLFGNDESLGVHAVHRATFMLIASPSGSYYAEGINPVGIMIENEDVRTVRGGTGYAKCGGNYAASTRAGERAAKKGYSQVLWLDGVERKYIEEVGAMNVMFKINADAHGFDFARDHEKELYRSVESGRLSSKRTVTLLRRARRGDGKRNAGRGVGLRNGGGRIADRKIGYWREGVRYRRR